MPVPLKSLSKSDDPFFVTLRTFQDDDHLWRWELSVWIGDVDVLGTAPNQRTRSPKAYKTRHTAYHNGIAAASRVT